MALEVACEAALLPLLVLISALSRFASRPYDVGIGPEPMVTHIALKKAFEMKGYRAQTFVSSTYFITNKFDVNLESFADLWAFRPFLRVILADSVLFAMAVWRYRCLYIRFNGGPLMRTRFLRRAEPWLLSLAGMRTIVCGYGG